MIDGGRGSLEFGNCRPPSRDRGPRREPLRQQLGVLTTALEQVRERPKQPRVSLYWVDTAGREDDPPPSRQSPDLVPVPGRLRISRDGTQAANVGRQWVGADGYPAAFPVNKRLPFGPGVRDKPAYCGYKVSRIGRQVKPDNVITQQTGQQARHDLCGEKPPGAGRGERHMNEMYRGISTQNLRRQAAPDDERSQVQLIVLPYRAGAAGFSVQLRDYDPGKTLVDGDITSIEFPHPVLALRSGPKCVMMGQPQHAVGKLVAIGPILLPGEVGQMQQPSPAPNLHRNSVPRRQPPFGRSLGGTDEGDRHAAGGDALHQACGQAVMPRHPGCAALCGRPGAIRISRLK
jgi:hypothetical protein